jgi:hypothetical protein
MIDPPGDHPFPHLELDAQEPTIFFVHKHEILFRHHQSIHDPIFFGMTGRYRFDDPTAQRRHFGCSTRVQIPNAVF